MRRALAARRPAGRRRVWVRTWLQDRVGHGFYDDLLRDLPLNDPDIYFNFMRMDSPMSQELLTRVGPKIVRQDTNFRDTLSPRLHLAITVRFLATGDSYPSLVFGFRVARNTIISIMPQTCEAIIQCYEEELLKCPKTPEEWLRVAEGFERRWNLPHCLGAIDGKHVAIMKSPNSSSIYYNYKKFFSVILMGIVDHSYKFLVSAIGAPGSAGDGGMFQRMDFWARMEEGRLGIPPSASIPGEDTNLPYFLVGDAAFPLRIWLMKPYPNCTLSHEKLVYNYRISRARRIVENAFGILSARYV